MAHLIQVEWGEAVITIPMSPRFRSAKNVAVLRFHLRLRLGEIKYRRFLTGLVGMIMTASYTLVG